MLLDRLISGFLNQEINYRTYALLRSILAFALLLTIVFNDYSVIYLENHIKILGFSITISWIKLISILVLLFTISGYYPQIGGILHFVVTYTFFSTCPFVDGGDQLSSNLTFLLIPATLFDSNKNHWVNNRNSFNGFYSRPMYLFVSLLIYIQIAMVYLHSSIGKLSVPEWRDGTVIWYWLTHEVFGASYIFLTFFKYILKSPFVIYLLNWSVIFIEIFIVLMLFVPKNRHLPRLIFYLAVFLHLFVILFHGIFTFSIIMIGSLIFYFQFTPGRK